jgi:hypothetical protein
MSNTSTVRYCHKSSLQLRLFCSVTSGENGETYLTWATSVIACAHVMHTCKTYHDCSDAKRKPHDTQIGQFQSFYCISNFLHVAFLCINAIQHLNSTGTPLFQQPTLNASPTVPRTPSMLALVAQSDTLFYQNLLPQILTDYRFNFGDGLCIGGKQWQPPSPRVSVSAW